MCRNDILTMRRLYFPGLTEQVGPRREVLNWIHVSTLAFQARAALGFFHSREPIIQRKIALRWPALNSAFSLRAMGPAGPSDLAGELLANGPCDRQLGCGDLCVHSFANMTGPRRCCPRLASACDVLGPTDLARCSFEDWVLEASRNFTN